MGAAENTKTANLSEESSAEEFVTRWGLEIGLWKVLTGPEELRNTGRIGLSSGETARVLLKKYGAAYLITSISLSIVSFTLCYTLVGLGVDVGGLLVKVGFKVNDTSEKVGRAALAYAAHKASSPLRFPPTVALTPIVAEKLARPVA